MDVKRIRTLRRADPFRPFNLVLDDGRKLPVDKAYFLAIAPEGEFLVHASVGGGFETVNPALVRTVDFRAVRRSTRRNGRKHDH